jgi:hypothetical protein
VGRAAAAGWVGGRRRRPSTLYGVQARLGAAEAGRGHIGPQCTRSVSCALVSRTPRSRLDRAPTKPSIPLATRRNGRAASAPPPHTRARLVQGRCEHHPAIGIATRRTPRAARRHPEAAIPAVRINRRRCMHPPTWHATVVPTSPAGLPSSSRRRHSGRLLGAPALTAAPALPSRQHRAGDEIRWAAARWRRCPRQPRQPCQQRHAHGRPAGYSTAWHAHARRRPRDEPSSRRSG